MMSKDKKCLEYSEKALTFAGDPVHIVGFMFMKCCEFPAAGDWILMDGIQI
jgi:hypothetical protein